MNDFLKKEKGKEGRKGMSENNKEKFKEKSKAKEGKSGKSFCKRWWNGRNKKKKTKIEKNKEIKKLN